MFGNLESWCDLIAFKGNGKWIIVFLVNSFVNPLAPESD